MNVLCCKASSLGEITKSVLSGGNLQNLNIQKVTSDASTSKGYYIGLIEDSSSSKTTKVDFYHLKYHPQ